MQGPLLPDEVGPAAEVDRGRGAVPNQIGPLGATFARISVQPTTRALPLMRYTAKMMDLIQIALQGVVSKQKQLQPALADAAEQRNMLVKQTPQR